MNQKQTGGIGAAALDLGLGDALKVQVNDQVTDQKTKQKKMKPVTDTFGNAAQDLMGTMGLGLNG
jgi:hypothetical protein